MFMGVGRALLDGVRDFVGFSVADADLPLTVANNGECSKGEPTTTFDHLGTAVDEDDLFDHRRTVALRLLIAIITTGAAIIAAWAAIAALAAKAAAALAARCTLFALGRSSHRGSNERGDWGWRCALRRGRGFGAHADF
jgi:hypothetical protein